MNPFVEKNIPVMRQFYSNLIQNGRQQNSWGPWTIFNNGNTLAAKQELFEMHRQIHQFISENYEKIAERCVLPHPELRKRKLNNFFALVKMLQYGLHKCMSMVHHPFLLLSLPYQSLIVYITNLSFTLFSSIILHIFLYHSYSTIRTI